MQEREDCTMDGSLIYLALMVAIGAFEIAAMWMVFAKAGEPGWASLIPIYNIFLLVRIAGLPWWQFLLVFVPIVQLVPVILVPLGVAKRFGKDVVFGLGLLFLPVIFYPVLAFGSARHTG